MRSLVLQQGFPSSLQQLVERYSAALISAATTVVLFVVAFVVIYLIARYVLIKLTKRVLDARGFDRTVVGLGGRVAGVVALIAALALAATIAGFGTVLAAFATLSA
ncbi:MAG TPA: mechanosensitive ion channel family protein, partial [Halococcus sp.]|nr:mechanosensitive ion channel family protein [Halococcus sp.]